MVAENNHAGRYAPDAWPLNADDLLRRCAPLNVQAIFSGHFHGFTERHFEKVRDNHDGSPEKRWFVCRAASGEIRRKICRIPILTKSAKS
jgi:hypothetical protein